MDKREQVLDAMTDLAATRGLYRVTVDELAARAGVSKRTIYRYFRSKDEIIAALMERFMNMMGREIERIVATGAGPADMLTGVVRLATQTGRTIINPLVLDDLRRYYPGLWDKIEQFRAEKIQQNIFRVLLNKDGGKFVGNVEPEIFAAAFLASVRAVVNPEFILDKGLTFEAAVEQLVKLFLFGIVGSEGNRVVE